MAARPEATHRGGASDAEIAQVAALANGNQLPPFYVAYLRELGRDTGRTKVGADGRATIAAILEHYADETERDRTPPGGLVVGVGCLIHTRMLMWPPDGGEPPIGCFLQGYTIDYVMAESFRHLCYQSTWQEARYGGRNVMMIDKKANVLSEVESVFAQFGTSKYWFSDRYGVYAESERLACMAILEGDTTFVAVAAPTPVEREQIYDELRLTVGLR